MPKDNVSDWDCECDWEDDNDFCDCCYLSRLLERRKLLKKETNCITTDKAHIRH